MRLFYSLRVLKKIILSSYPYRDPHVKDKTVSRDRHVLNMGIQIPGKGGLYIETWPQIPLYEDLSTPFVSNCCV